MAESSLVRMYHTFLNVCCHHELLQLALGIGYEGVGGIRVSYEDIVRGRYRLIGMDGSPANRLIDSMQDR